MAQLDRTTPFVYQIRLGFPNIQRARCCNYRIKIVVFRIEVAHKRMSRKINYCLERELM